MITYQLSNDSRRNTLVSILKRDGNAVLVIPFDPDNTDYQEYLKWVAEGNTPEPADE
jgi:hypothetical protein